MQLMTTIAMMAECLKKKKKLVSLFNVAMYGTNEVAQHFTVRLVNLMDGDVFSLCNLHTYIKYADDCVNNTLLVAAISAHTHVKYKPAFNHV